MHKWSINAFHKKQRLYDNLFFKEMKTLQQFLFRKVNTNQCKLTVGLIQQLQRKHKETLNKQSQSGHGK